VADLYPKLTLGASAGPQSESLMTLTNWASRFLTAGPTVELPIFDAGRRRATVRLQDVKAEEAALDYRRTVLTALNEVGNALAAYGADQARRTALSGTVAGDRDAVDLTRQRYASGVGSFIDVLDAELTLEQNDFCWPPARPPSRRTLSSSTRRWAEDGHERWSASNRATRLLARGIRASSPGRHVPPSHATCTAQKHRTAEDGNARIAQGSPGHLPRNRSHPHQLLQNLRITF
jgi:hypothetical protein